MVSLGGFSFEVRADTAQAEAAFARLRTAAAQTGQAVNASLGGQATSVNTTAAQQSFTRVETAAQQAQQAANFTVSPRVDTKQAEASLTHLQQLGQGALRGLVAGSGVGGNLLIGAGVGAGAAGALAAAVAVERLTVALKDGVAAGIEYNSRLEQLTNTFIQETGSTDKAAQAIAGLRQLATTSPFKESQVLGAGESFIRVAQGDVGRMQQLVTLTTALAAAKPQLGFEGASAAIQQLISGDYRAFEDRTNITFGTVRELAAQGATGMELFTKAVERAGGSLELLQRNATTFQARTTTLQSNIEALGGAFTKPAFDALSGDIDRTNKAIAENKNEWLLAAGALGRYITLFTQISGGGAGIFALPEATRQALEETQRRRQAPPAAANTPLEAFQTQRRADVQAAGSDLENQLNVQQRALEEIQRQHQANAASAAQITAQYETQAIPLRNALALLQQGNLALQAQALSAQRVQASITGRREQALGSIDVRADVARSNVLIDAGERQARIRQQQAEIGERAAARASAAQDRAAEAAIRGQERVVQGLQREIQARQEARQDALEAAREVADAEAQARRDALDGLQEQIRARREAASDAVEAVREEQRAREQAYQDALRGTERVHQAQQDAARDAIEALQEQARAADRAAQEALRNSAAQRALTALDESERRRGQAQSLAAAQRAVREATTFSGRRDAQDRLEEVKHQISVENRRIALEKKIAAEKEAADKASEARQDVIRTAEQKAREADREYQRTRDAQEDAHRTLVEAQAAANREADKAEHAAERAEDAQVREQEKADRAADRAAQQALLDQEKADRAAARADQAALQGAQDSLQAARDHQADVQRERQDTADRIRGEREAEIDGFVSARLANEQKILDSQDTATLAQLAYEQTIADHSAAILKNAQDFDTIARGIQALDIEGKLREIENAERTALEPLQINTVQFEAQQKAAEATATALERQLQAQKTLLGLFAPGPTLGPEVPEGITPGSATIPVTIGLPEGSIAKVAQDALDGLIDYFTNGDHVGLLADAVQGLIQAGVLDASRAKLRAQSPSLEMSDIGGDAAQGFVNGFSAKEEAVKTAMESPFDYELTTYLPPFIRSFGTEGTTAAQSFIGNYALAKIEDALGAPFDTFSSAYVPIYERNFGIYAANIAQAVIDGFGSRDVLGALEEPFKRFINIDSPLLDAQLKVEGQYAADGFIDGWNERMQDRKLEIVYRDSGGNGGGLDLGAPIGNAPATGSVLPASYSSQRLALVGGRTTGAQGRTLNFNPTLNINAPGASPQEVLDIVTDGLRQFAQELEASAVFEPTAPSGELAGAG